MTPGESTKEYIQWQRGPLTKIDISQMKAWVDTVMSHDNNWLVLVFHGVENLGWEPKTRGELVEYFAYMKQHEKDLWIATFRDVTKYLRERKATIIQTEVGNDEITVRLSSELDPLIYNFPLTFKTYVPSNWSAVQVKQGDQLLTPEIQSDGKGKYLLYQVSPTGGIIQIKKG